MAPLYLWYQIYFIQHTSTATLCEWYLVCFIQGCFLTMIPDLLHSTLALKIVIVTLSKEWIISLLHLNWKFLYFPVFDTIQSVANAFNTTFIVHTYVSIFLKYKYYRNTHTVFISFAIIMRHVYLEGLRVRVSYGRDLSFLGKFSVISVCPRQRQPGITATLLLPPSPLLLLLQMFHSSTWKYFQIFEIVSQWCVWSLTILFFQGLVTYLLRHS